VVFLFTDFGEIFLVLSYLVFVYQYSKIGSSRKPVEKIGSIFMLGILISDLRKNMSYLFNPVLQPDGLLIFPYSWKKQPDRCIGPPPLKDKKLKTESV